MSDSALWQAPPSDHENDESRIYFGPFKSPEKKYIGAGLAVPQAITPSPLRRSPRLSSPIPHPPPGPMDEGEGGAPFEDEDDELSRSRSGTPDNDRWQQDEPSSMLASRITRAHDNPSPPPSPPVQDFDSAPPTPDRYPTHPIFIIPGSPSPPSRGGSPFSPRPPPSPQNTTQPDLISFDSFSTSAHLPPAHPIASTSFIPLDTHAPSVDELLSSWSPSAQSPSALDIPSASVSPPPSEIEGGNSKGKSRVSGDWTPEAAEEQAVVDALIVPDTQDSASSVQSPPGVTISADAQASNDDAPRTPLRRSTRPRRSGTPHAHLVPLPSSDDEESPIRALTPSSALTKKKPRKGKEREMLVATDSQSGEAESSGNATNGIFPSEQDREMKRRKERGERKQAMPNGTPQALLQRQLGSLSPGSANVLTQLLTPSRPSPVREQEEPQQPPFSFSVFPVANPVHTTPARMTSPIRASPVRHAKPRSPSRIQFQAPSVNDPNRTPARRIPVEQAVARGQISPQKGVQLLANNLDAGPLSRTPVFHIPSQDSPARRVNVAPPSDSQGKFQGMRFGSPTRGRSRERSGSVEPRPPWNGIAAAGPSDLGAFASKSRSSPSRSMSAPIKKGKLPFPLTPSGPDRPAPIPEEKVLSPNADALENPTPPPPVLGVIKVPRSVLKQPTSRIPRIGSKPYARPAAAPSSDKSKAPAAAPRKPVEKARVPSARTIKVARTVSSDDMKMAEAGPSSLKRKRVPSPLNKPRPVVLLRQVAHTTYMPKQPAPMQAAPSPVKKPPMAKFRMVDLHTRPNGAVDAADSILPDPEVPAEPARDELDTLRSPTFSSPIITPLELSSDPQPPSSPPPELGSVRRTTRLRKSVFPASAGPPQPQPLPTRRKVSRQEPPSSGAFAGMTAVALKALTSSNTTKNQKYLAAKLETEVVRKEGARPESPAVKIRTIAQREQEEKSTSRKARAARRARRSDDGFSETDDAGDSSMLDIYSDDMGSSPVRRHTRGPGDEEDYESPGRPVKRARSGSVSDDERQAEKKRVKWHRGLSTVVFLDEVEPGTKARPKENLFKKGCLAPTAKALRLDPLGNHPNAESPLKDLVEENIVVKKFVYDNDDEPVLPVIVVKNTRSKAKKKS
ncbi:hypothetical protein B0H17DRAFT_1324739 [Mycena rosella]|uniref:Uncharacterized protein n=1 Tax=Mycena rosella TaxID=1033263 RepID=A0AAD7H274_MYCRO|nr:hypothetical protein B0H17DRAFT_1324739 [Mycena rosella]